ncbi:MAG TPA: ankyrin repeat domain-containing protein [Blastocatellia bacterium]|nr:ankyrin repeat domain-containing protein [Blastocatellia bacterium]
MNQRRNSNLLTFLTTFLATFFGSVLIYQLCAEAAMQDKGSNEKLLTAIRDADAQTARALLSLVPGGADANARDEDGLTALMYAAMYAGADCVELLLAQGADPNAKSKSDVTALMLAIGQADKVRLLLAKGAEVNAESKQGHTALTIAAARAGSAEVVKALLDNGADLTVANALGAAAKSGDISVAQLLLERGADPNDRNNVGGPPPMSAKRASERPKSGGTPFMPPLLGAPGNTGATPLMYAALAGNTEVIKLLLGKGADVNARDNGAGAALILASAMGDPATVKLLLEKGAEVNVRNELGYTALMCATAAETNDPELIKALLARRAEIDVKAKDGETALKLAGRKGNTEIVRLLKKAGAKE